MLEAAGPDLQSLALDNTWYDMRYQEPSVGELSGLTKVELSKYTAVSRSSLEALRSLGLRSLVLLNCPGVEVALSKPGSLTALKVLHMEELEQSLTREWRHPALQTDPHTHENREQQLQGAGRVVLNLPELCQLSASSEALFTWEHSLSQFSAETSHASISVSEQSLGDDRASKINTYARIWDTETSLD